MVPKRLKIFVDGHVFDQEYQGTQTFLRGLYTQLMVDYPTLEIYFGVQDVAKFKKQFPHFPAERILCYQKRSFGLLRFVFDIPFYLKKHRFDFAHFQYISPKQTNDCKYIVTLHDTIFNDFKSDFSWAYRISRNVCFGYCIKHASIKTTVSNYSRQQIHQHYQVPLQQLHVIPNGIDSHLPITDNVRQKAVERIEKEFGIKNFILYVCRIEPRKNHSLVLETYLKLKLYQQQISLVFIGSESISVSKFNSLVTSLDPEQRQFFHWIEKVDQTTLNDFYLASKLFVYASKAEGFGIPPLEAAGFHQPVLCSKATALKDFDFFEPYFFNPLDRAEFEHKLSSMLTSPPSATYLNNVAEQIKEKYNWKTSAALFYNLLTTAP